MKSIRARDQIKWVGVVVGVLAALGLLTTQALAHGSQQVGDYTVEIGFKVEPAYQSYPNGLELIVTRTADHQPVTGLETTLKAEIIYGADRKQLALSPDDENDGVYTAPVIPTEAGDYTWHITGTIESTPVDISMTSSPTTFASVIASDEDAFPNRGGSSESTGALQKEIQRDRQLAVIALVVGALGALLGVASLFSARKP